MQIQAIFYAQSEIFNTRVSIHSVIPSIARNIPSIDCQQKKEGFLAALGMTRCGFGCAARKKLDLVR